MVDLRDILRVFIWASCLALLAACENTGTVEDDDAIGDDDDDDSIDDDDSDGDDDDTANWTVDSFEQTGNTVIDILAVLNSSISMEDQYDVFRTDMQELVGDLADARLDVHLGFTTMEDCDDAWDPPIGELAVPRIEDVTDPGAQGQVADAMGAIPADAIACNSVGLESAYLALTPPLEGGINAGFRRNEAYLVTIFLSDWLYCNIGWTDCDDYISPEDFVAWWEPFVDDASGGTLLAIVGDQYTGCDYPQGGSAYQGDAYFEVTGPTGTYAVSICDMEWSAPLNDAVDPGLSAFPLSVWPQEESLEVTVDGTYVAQAADCWNYQGDGNHVQFEVGCLPQKGDEVEIRYLAL